MEEDITIAQGLRVTDSETKYDEACKRLLYEKPILARIMKAVMPEYKDCDVNDIAKKYIKGMPEISSVSVLPDEKSTVIKGTDTEDKSLHEGSVHIIFDFTLLFPKPGNELNCSNVEVQNAFYLGYPLIKRCLYYCCRMISS